MREKQVDDITEFKFHSLAHNYSIFFLTVCVYPIAFRFSSLFRIMFNTYINMYICNLITIFTRCLAQTCWTFAVCEWFLCLRNDFFVSPLQTSRRYPRVQPSSFLPWEGRCTLQMLAWSTFSRARWAPCPSFRGTRQGRELQNQPVWGWR